MIDFGLCLKKVLSLPPFRALFQTNVTYSRLLRRSLMDVVVAVEGVRVLCLVFDAFNLDCGMVQFELTAAPVSHGSQRLQRLV